LTRVQCLLILPLERLRYGRAPVTDLTVNIF
jgi:hypothetical protein